MSTTGIVRPIYRHKDQWVLCACVHCGNLHYVEPHGITAQCRTCKGETQHRSIPFALRDISGTVYRGPRKIPGSYVCARNDWKG